MALSQFFRNANKCSVFLNPTLSSRLYASSAVRSVSNPNSTHILKVVKRVISTTPIKLASAGTNHASLWTLERAFSLGLLAAIPGAFIFPSQVMDALLAVSVLMHQHWGIEAMVTDYVRPVVFGNIVPKIAHAALFVVSAATLAGLFYLIYNDIGIAKTVKKLWSIKGQ